LFHDPNRLLGEFVSDGMTVLEPGPGVGFFTLELLRLVGPTGKVVAVDVQRGMLDAIRRRAEKVALADRLDLRHVGGDRMDLADLAAKVDFALAFAMVHEVPNAATFLAEVAAALRPGGRLLVAEPIIHVKKKDFSTTLRAAESAGLRVDKRPAIPLSHAAVLVRDQPGPKEA
jgi:ubiquinone/menaquinone biosynthesis C-methylase UbiE